MIKSYKEFKRYLCEDANGFKSYLSSPVRSHQMSNPASEQRLQWEYIFYLRLSEYAYNTHKRLLCLFALLRLRHYAHKSSFQIPLNVCGAGLAIYHLGPIIIKGQVRIGKNASLQPNIVTGAKRGTGGSPVIGGNFYCCGGGKNIGGNKNREQRANWPQCVCI